MFPVRSRLEMQARAESKDEIIRNIRRTDFWYRFFLILMVAIVLVGISFAIVGQFRILNQVRSAQQQEKQQIEQLNRHMDCIVRYDMEKPGTRQITDIDECTFGSVSTGVSTSKTVVVSPQLIPGPQLQNPTTASQKPSKTQPQKSQQSSGSNSSDSTDFLLQVGCNKISYGYDAFGIVKC